MRKRRRSFIRSHGTTLWYISPTVAYRFSEVIELRTMADSPRKRKRG